jgi:sulfate permease, SulP family
MVKSTRSALLSGGIESTLQGLTITVAPLILLVSFFGSLAVGAGFWSILISACVVPVMYIVLKGPAALISGTSVASVTAYFGLMFNLAVQLGYAPNQGTDLSLAQLKIVFAAGSLLFLLASFLVLLCGFLRLGKLFSLIPTPVASGISNATAILMLLLGIHEMWGSVWVTTMTALTMLLCYVFWENFQYKARMLGFLPASIVAIGLGLALTLMLDPNPAPGSWWIAPDFTWTSILLWTQLDQPGLLPLLLAGLPAAFSLALIIILGTFTTAAVMETRFGVKTSPNRTLVAVGGANLVSALLGGLPANPQAIRSIASWNAGGRGVAAAWVSLSMTSLAILGLGAFLIAMPVGLVAGLFLIQGFALADRHSTRRLWELIRSPSVKKLGSSDMGFWTTIIITGVGVAGNMVWACFLGIGLSCLLVLRRLSGSLTAQWDYLNRYRSRRVRNPLELSMLEQELTQVGVLRLTGHLFFGNSQRILQLADEIRPEAVFAVIDVNRIVDVDPTGIGALQALLNKLVKRHITVVVTGLAYTQSEELKLALQDLPKVHYQVDMDRGLEHCENLLLQKSSRSSVHIVRLELEQNALMQDLSVQEIEAVKLLAQFRSVEHGQYLFRRDQASDGIWLIQEGLVSILAGDHDTARLTTCGPGQFMGEMSLIDGKARSASARAESDVKARLLDAKAMEALSIQQPFAVQKILRNLAKELSFRLRVNSSLLTNEVEETNPVWSNSTLSPLSRF